MHTEDDEESEEPGKPAKWKHTVDMEKIRKDAEDAEEDDTLDMPALEFGDKGMTKAMLLTPEMRAILSPEEIKNIETRSKYASW